MKAAATNYYKADSVDHALSLSASLGGMAKYLAGGQSLLPMMNLRLAMPEALIDISGLAALREVRLLENGLFIGAGVTHAMIEDGRVPEYGAGFLQHVAGGIAYRSIRNQGTVGGSLVHADPSADWSTALLALNATAVIRSDAGIRHVPLGTFQTGLMETSLEESEVLLGVLLPILSVRTRWAYRKFCYKVGELAHSLAAVVIDPEHELALAVVGAAADTPYVLPRVSASLRVGLHADAVALPSFTQLVEADLAEGTSHEPASYEFHLHKTIITRAVSEALTK